MKLTFFGVRGSIAAPGPDTAEFGGNTSCVALDLPSGERIVFDAGTGLRALGNRMMAAKERCDLSILLSHYHWDHIQGLPFFVPMYMPGSRIEIVGGVTGVMSVRETLVHQMQAPVFPVCLEEAPAALETREVRAGSTFDVRGASVRVAKLNHPGGVFAYRVEHGGRSVVYATDTEHYACVDPALVALARGADVLVYDAQYTPEEYGSKVGWGHSTYVAGAEVAKAAGVSQLVLFHHDPTRSDGAVRAIEARARELFPGAIAAREGLVLGVGTSPNQNPEPVLAA
jgi:phosphoribosyl 1,2-cyclic phosphodiesterase